MICVIREPRRLSRHTVVLETDGKLGRVYSYFNFARGRRVYIHILSEYAARINERLALKRANRGNPLAHLASAWYTKNAIELLTRHMTDPYDNLHFAQAPLLRRDYPNVH